MIARREMHDPKQPASAFDLDGHHISLDPYPRSPERVRCGRGHLSYLSRMRYLHLQSRMLLRNRVKTRCGIKGRDRCRPLQGMTGIRHWDTGKTRASGHDGTHGSALRKIDGDAARSLSSGKRAAVLLEVLAGIPGMRGGKRRDVAFIDKIAVPIRGRDMAALIPLRHYQRVVHLPQLRIPRIGIHFSGQLGEDQCPGLLAGVFIEFPVAGIGELPHLPVL